MDSRRVDGITRLFANLRLSRRRVVRQGGAGIAGALIAAGAGPAIGLAQGATPVAGEDVELLFVQSFGSGAIAPNAEASGTFTLTLEGGVGQTIYFSDRPNRVVGAVATSEFVTYLLESTADDPANAALVADGTDGEMILVVELTSASLDAATGTLTYDALLLGEEDVDMVFEQAVAAAPAAEMPLGTCHLFIDGLAGCSPWDPRC